MDHWVIQYSYLIPLLPLAGAAIAGFFGAKWLKGQSHWPIWLTVGASAVMSIMLLVGMVKRMPAESAYQTTTHTTATGAEQDQVAGPASLDDHFTYATTHKIFTWIQAGKFKADFGFFFDSLTAVMLCVVCGIGFLITIYSAGYMKGEEGYFRFFAYLGLFIFSMTCLVMGDNFIMLYLGWEGVGLCSYLLIGYYYHKPSAREAAKKAFITNRIGDFGFGLGIMLAYSAFGTVSYFGDGSHHGVLIQVLEGGTGFQHLAGQVLPFLLLMGAVGKSAQFPLYVWLPDAMEGPSPVSALIHAATMVTAGVYMIARCSTLFALNASASTTVAVIGAFTAVFAATIALRQFDLKKVFAYSTISQLGFMFVGVGVLAPVAGIFHLVTHAFFKALLFLGAGVVMHAMAGELDMRKMSGLKRVLPKTRIIMLIGCLALAGVIPFAGFWSKDDIVVGAWERSHLLGVVMLFAALLTAYYTFRLYFRVFQGPLMLPPTPEESGHGHDSHDSHGHDDHAHHNHEPMLMILPLAVLALGAFAAGIINLPSSLAPENVSHKLAAFLGHSPSFTLGYFTAVVQKQHVDPAAWGQMGDVEPAPASGINPHGMLMVASILIAFLGILLAYLYHLKDRARGDALARRFPRIRVILEGKYFVDEIYQAAIIEPLRTLGRIFYWIDRMVVDGAVNVLGFVPQFTGFALKLTTQRGSLQGYALMMLAGVAAILLLIFTR